MHKQKEIKLTPELKKCYAHAQSEGIDFILQLTETGDYSWGDTDINILEYISREAEVIQKIHAFGIEIPKTTYTKYYTLVVDARDVTQPLSQNVCYTAKEWLNKT